MVCPVSPIVVNPLHGGGGGEGSELLNLNNPQPLNETWMKIKTQELEAFTRDINASHYLFLNIYLCSYSFCFFSRIWEINK